jgi:hypothetical protein
MACAPGGRSAHLPRDSPGHADEPPANRTRGAGGGEARCQDEERGLKRIIGRAGPNQPTADAIYHRSVPMHELGKGVLVAPGREAVEQLGIGSR